jgi:hypothetical protein
MTVWHVILMERLGAQFLYVMWRCEQTSWGRMRSVLSFSSFAFSRRRGTTPLSPASKPGYAGKCCSRQCGVRRSMRFVAAGVRAYHTYLPPPVFASCGDPVDTGRIVPVARLTVDASGRKSTDADQAEKHSRKEQESTWHTSWSLGVGLYHCQPLQLLDLVCPQTDLFTGSMVLILSFV